MTGGGGAIVVGRGGWLQLPEDLLARAGISDPATARLGPEGIVVAAVDGAPEGRPEPSPPPERLQPLEGGTVVVRLGGVSRAFGGGESATIAIQGLDAGSSAPAA